MPTWRYLWGAIKRTLTSLFYPLPFAITVFVLYSQWRSNALTNPLSGPTVTLLTLMVVTFLLWIGGPSLLSRIQELGPLKLAPRVAHETERLRPEMERELAEMERLEQGISEQEIRMNLDLNPALPEEKKPELQRALNRIGPLLTYLRLVQDPHSFNENLKASYCLLTYWEARLLYHLGSYEEALGKWQSAWDVGRAGLLEQLTGTRFQFTDFCVYVGNAYILVGKPEDAARTGRLKAAVSWYRRALSADRHLGKALFNLAWAYDELRAYDRAVLSLTDYLKIRPESIGGLYNRACAYSKAGRLLEAMQDIRNLPCPHSVWSVADQDGDLANLRNSGEFGGELTGRIEKCRPPE